MMAGITTLDYGILPIAKNRKWLLEDCLDVITTPGASYEVRKTFNGALVALKIKHQPQRG